MTLHLSDNSIPFSVERPLTDSTTTTTTSSLSSSSSNLLGNKPSNVGPLLPPIPLTSSSSTLLSSSASLSTSSGTGSPSSISSTGSLTSSSSTEFQSTTSSTGSRSSTETSTVSQALTSPQPFPSSTEALSSGTTSGPMTSQLSLLWYHHLPRLLWQCMLYTPHLSPFTPPLSSPTYIFLLHAMPSLFERFRFERIILIPRGFDVCYPFIISAKFISIWKWLFATNHYIIATYRHWIQPTCQFDVTQFESSINFYVDGREHWLKFKYVLVIFFDGKL
ncbi:hypothetical protein AZE42_06450 [Rhizopogon vesiculosus]|uniref:Uncharacterized protein n=1 Tax=Rhizopogon vesiculosus TaxID=180088 RepID=A0A1J8Q048_9AGAM|nr:hypothetical protein AZE42_06450 [Rhizopogon vesiculosus]